MDARTGLDQTPPVWDTPPRFVSWPCANRRLRNKPFVGNHKPDIEENARASRQQVVVVNVVSDQEVWDTFAS